MSRKKKHDAYVSVKRGENGLITGFSYGGDLKAVKDLVSKKGSGKQSSTLSEKPTPENDEEVQPLQKMMNKAIDAISSQSELLFIIGFLKSFYTPFVLNEDIVKSVEASGVLVEEGDELTVYGITLDAYKEIVSKFEKFNRVERGIDAMPAALLMSIVATFDSTTADIVRDMLALKSENLQTGDKRGFAPGCASGGVDSRCQRKGNQ